jgi:hypothetical protein
MFDALLPSEFVFRGILLIYNVQQCRIKTGGTQASITYRFNDHMHFIRYCEICLCIKKYVTFMNPSCSNTFPMRVLRRLNIVILTTDLNIAHSTRANVRIFSSTVNNIKDFVLFISYLILMSRANANGISARAQADCMRSINDCTVHICCMTNSRSKYDSVRDIE